jgi:hypothetical protein
MGAMENIKAKLTGRETVQGDASVSTPNPMLLGLMKSFGLSPEVITGYADAVKNAVGGKLSMIDDKLDNILTIVRTQEMKLAEIECNQRVLLDAAEDRNEEQFAQMAEHTLSEPIV